MKRKGIFFLMILLIMLVSVVTAAFGKQKQKFYDQPMFYQLVTVQKGDNVWSIAEQYHKSETALDKYVDYIMDFNHMENDRIYPNQTILIPVFCEAGDK